MEVSEEHHRMSLAVRHWLSSLFTFRIGHISAEIITFGLWYQIKAKIDIFLHMERCTAKTVVFINYSIIFTDPNEISQEQTEEREVNIFNF